MPEDRLIVDYRTPPSEQLELQSLGFHVILSQALESLYDAVKGHPDLQFVNACGTLICHRDLSTEKAAELEGLGIPFILSDHRLKMPYPGHIILNATVTDDLLIHRLRDTDPSLLRTCPDLRHVDVRQGYTRCALAWVGKDSYVTNDMGIAKKLQALDRNVLLLPYGDVFLEGFSHGFIGGCLSLVRLRSEPLLLVTGDLSCYRHGDLLRDFLRNVGVLPCSIGSDVLKDRGSIIQV